MTALQALVPSTNPAQSPAEAQSHSTFLALMWALSYPGSQFALPTHVGIVEDLLVIGRSLLDLETSYFASNPTLATLLAKTGAILQSAQRADYIFYIQFTEADLAQMQQLKTGDFTYPDQSATVIIACQFDSADSTTFTLAGPGNLQARTIRLAGLPDAFWEVRRALIRYPLGIDIVLVSQGWVMGLPRTTQVTPCM